jgi:hypothetical protein
MPLRVNEPHTEHFLLLFTVAFPVSSIAVGYNFAIYKLEYGEEIN